MRRWHVYNAWRECCAKVRGASDSPVPSVPAARAKIVVSPYVWQMLIYVAAAAGVLLVALWTTTERGQRFRRAIILWGVILLLVPMRAYDAAAMLTVSAVLTIGLTLGIRRLLRIGDVVASHAATATWHYQVGDLLVLTLFVATLLGLARQCLPTLEYPDVLYQAARLCLLSLPLATVVSFSYFAVTGPRRASMVVLVLISIAVSSVCLRLSQVYGYFWEVSISRGHWARNSDIWLRVEIGLLLCLLFCLALVAALWRARRESAALLSRLMLVVALGVLIPLAWLSCELLWTLQIGKDAFGEMAVQAVPLACLAAFIAWGVWLARLCSEPECSQRRRNARTVATLCAMALGIPGLWLYGQMVWLTPIPATDFGPQNHYARIIEIADEAGYPDWSHPNPLTSEQQAALDEAVTLLQSPNYVPLAVLEQATRARQFQDRESLRRSYQLADRLQDAARRAQQADNFDRAADYALAIERYRGMLGRGGPFSMYFGDGWGGYSCLAKLSQRVSPEKARVLIELLQRSLSEREDSATLFARQMAIEERAGGWRARMQSVLERNSRAEGFLRVDESCKRTEAINLLFQTELAIQVFQHEHGCLPASLDELTPDILFAVPVDPFSGGPLSYRVEDGKFLLYSVGADHADNGGRSSNRMHRRFGYDLDLNQYSRE